MQHLAIFFGFIFLIFVQILYLLQSIILFILNLIKAFFKFIFGLLSYSNKKI